MAQYRYAGVSIMPNYKSHTLEFAVSDLHFATVHGLRTDLGGCKIPKFSEGMPPDPATNLVYPCCALAMTISWLRHCYPDGRYMHVESRSCTLLLVTKLSASQDSEYQDTALAHQFCEVLVSGLFQHHFKFSVACVCV